MPTEDISTKEAARLLNVSQRTIERYIQSGKLQAKPLDPKAKRITYIVSRASLASMGKTK